MEVKDNFFSRIEEVLKKRKITQKEMVETIGISAQTFTNWKSRNSLPSADIACKIAQYLNTSVEYLVTGTETDEFKDKFDTLIQDIQDCIDSYK